jgi:hypothetical protein
MKKINPEDHPVSQTLEAFENVFESILDLAKIGEISPVEDELLAGISGKLHELHEQFGERVMLDALKVNGMGDDEDAASIKKKLQTRLVMQAEVGRGSDLSELATQELFDTLDENDSN